MLYERIKQRRTELGLSQSELADKLGYKDRSTIAKIEKGINDIPQSKIKEFAEALDTTPGDLLGWESPEYSDMLTKEIIEGLNKLPKDKKKLVIDMIKAMNDKSSNK